MTTFGHETIQKTFFYTDFYQFHTRVNLNGSHIQVVEKIGVKTVIFGSKSKGKNATTPESLKWRNCGRSTA